MIISLKERVYLSWKSSPDPERGKPAQGNVTSSQLQSRTVVLTTCFSQPKKVSIHLACLGKCYIKLKALLSQAKECLTVVHVSGPAVPLLSSCCHLAVTLAVGGALLWHRSSTLPRDQQQFYHFIILPLFIWQMLLYKVTYRWATAINLK